MYLTSHTVSLPDEARAIPSAFAELTTLDIVERGFGIMLVVDDKTAKALMVALIARYAGDVDLDGLDPPTLNATLDGLAATVNRYNNEFRNLTADHAEAIQAFGTEG